jgi:hypothetical protein
MVAAITASLPWTLQGQQSDKDEASVNMLNLKVIALTQAVTTLQEKVAALQGQTSSRVKAPFEVVDGTGKAIAKIEVLASGRPAMSLGIAGGGVTMGIGASGSGVVLVRRADGTPGVDLSQSSGRPLGVYVLDAAGAKPVAELTSDAKGNGKLTIGDPSTGGVQMGVGASGGGVHVVRRADGKVGVDISQLGGRTLGVRVLDATGEKPVAELGSDASGGGAITVTDSMSKPVLRVSEKASVKDARVSIGAPEGRYGINIASPSGSILAGVGEGMNGAGAVSTFDRTGALRAVMNGLQGEIHMVDATGKSRATMTADGAFTIRNASGTTVARIGEGKTGAGLLQIANSGGDAMVEAGVLDTGAGVVRAYPLGTPGAGLIGLPGTFIMGRLGQK